MKSWYGPNAQEECERCGKRLELTRVRGLMCCEMCGPEWEKLVTAATGEESAPKESGDSAEVRDVPAEEGEDMIG